MDKIDSICKFLSISRSELLEKDMSKELEKVFIQSEPNKTSKELVKECECVGITIDDIIDDYSKQGFSKQEKDLKRVQIGPPRYYILFHVTSNLRLSSI